jgi:hypothetical protein
MTETKETRNETRRRAADVLIDLLKSLPFRERLAEGSLTALQAVCGACLAYGIACALHMQQAFWAAITAIAVTQHSYADTRNLSRDQFIGAMAGGLFGFAGASLGAGTHEILGYAMTIAAVIIFCWCVNVGSAARLGAITATSHTRAAMGCAFVPPHAGRPRHSVHAARQLALHSSSAQAGATLAPANRTKSTPVLCNSSQTSCQLPSKLGRTLKRPRLDDFNATIGVARVCRLQPSCGGLSQLDI